MSSSTTDPVTGANPVCQILIPTPPACIAMVTVESLEY